MFDLVGLLLFMAIFSIPCLLVTHMRTDLDEDGRAEETARQ